MADGMKEEEERTRDALKEMLQLELVFGRLWKGWFGWRHSRTDRWVHGIARRANRRLWSTYKSVGYYRDWSSVYSEVWEEKSSIVLLTGLRRQLPQRGGFENPRGGRQAQEEDELANADYSRLRNLSNHLHGRNCLAGTFGRREAQTQV